MRRREQLTNGCMDRTDRDLDHLPNAVLGSDIRSSRGQILLTGPVRRKLSAILRLQWKGACPQQKLNKASATDLPDEARSQLEPNGFS